MGIIEPTYCPNCGSDNIRTTYDNYGNGSFEEWYSVDCSECGAYSGKVSIDQ